MITSLYVMPTLACNCRCSYCYIPEKEKKGFQTNKDFVPVLQRFIEDFPEDSPELPQLRFIGGEPCLEKDTIIELAGIFFSAFPEGLVVVNTNGTLITPEYTGHLAKYGTKLVHIVSLDGLQALHDARRKLLFNGDGGDSLESWSTSGEKGDGGYFTEQIPGDGGSFHKAVEGIRQLMAAGLPVYCNMVLDESSVEEIDAFFMYLKNDLQMDSVSVSLVSREDNPLSKEQKWDLLQKAYHTAEMHDLEIGGHHRLLAGEKISRLRCRAGEKTAVIAPDLRVYACQRFVGRAEAAPWQQGNSLEALAGMEQVQSCCYTEDARWLGEKLYGLYRQQYPEYLEVSRLDKVLFGVI